MTQPKYVTPKQLTRARNRAGFDVVDALFDLGLIAHEPDKTEHPVKKLYTEGDAPELEPTDPQQKRKDWLINNQREEIKVLMEKITGLESQIETQAKTIGRYIENEKDTVSADYWKMVAEGWQRNSDTYRAELKTTKTERDTWKQTAQDFETNARFYRDIAEQIGKTIGIDAYTADDGSLSTDVLITKLPELVTKLVQANTDMKVDMASADRGRWSAQCADHPGGT